MLAGGALYLGSMYWLETRKLIALDVPVSLSRGHIRTEEFSINLDSGYYIEIEVEETPSLGNLECLMWGCYETPAILKARWALSRAGQVELSGSSDDVNGGSGNVGTVGRKVGYFRSSGGRYKLDVDVLSDTSFLNTGNPRLKVESDGEGHYLIHRLYVELPIVSWMLVLIGGTLFWRSKQNVEQSTALEISVAPRTGYQRPNSLRKFPGRPLFSGLPPYGITATLALLLLVGISVSVTIKPPSKGIRVFTSSRSLRTPKNDQRIKPLVLRIDKENRWFLDGKAILPEDFSGILKEALSRRPDWLVYLDADPNLPFGVPAQAMDMIQGLYARTILVTPGIEKDCCTGTGSQ